jgi:tripartite-type tricarboxylate transporter receptor subunit TctC
MRMVPVRRGLLALATLSIPVGHARAEAQWPDRPVRILLPVAPGDGGDVVGRLLAARMAAELGQPVLIENRPGAAGLLALEQVARARPDGHTLGYGNAALLAIRPHLAPRMSVDVLRDIAMVTLVVTSPVLLAAGPALDVRSFAELAAAARQRPGAIAYGSFGTGSLGHLSQEALNRALGLGLIHVPYPGIGPALNDLLAGRLALLWLDPVTAAAPVASGAAQILAVAARARTPLYPEAPTVAELGAPFALENWSGLVAPAGVPTAASHRVAEALANSLADPWIAARLAGWGLEPRPEGPATFRRRLEEDLAACGRLVRLAGIRLD